MLWQLLGMEAAPEPSWWPRAYVDAARDLEGQTAYQPRCGAFTGYNGPLRRFVDERLVAACEQDLTTRDRSLPAHAHGARRALLLSHRIRLRARAHRRRATYATARSRSRDGVGLPSPSQYSLRAPIVDRAPCRGVQLRQHERRSGGDGTGRRSSVSAREDAAREADAHRPECRPGKAAPWSGRERVGQRSDRVAPRMRPAPATQSPALKRV